MPEFSVTMYDEAADSIRSHIENVPEVGLILGSGLNSLAEDVEDAVAVAICHIHKRDGVTPA